MTPVAQIRTVVKVTSPTALSAYRRRRIASTVAAFGVVAALTMAACTQSGQRSTSAPAATRSAPTRPATSSPSTSSPSTVSTEPVATLPATTHSSAVRGRLDWFLEQINAGTGDPATVAVGFAPIFLASIPIDKLIASVGSAVADGANWTITDFTEADPVDASATITSAEGLQIRVELGVEPGGDHRIDSLQLTPILADVFPRDQPVTPDTFDAALRRLAPNVSFGLYDTTDGTCQLVHGLEADTARPIGSTFKLWILAALATEIDAGRASWDETMPVTASLVSTPDGESASTPIGTPVTLRRYAELMISVSDNSATDHLLHRLGRHTVELAMRDAGIVDAERNIPMLSTRELFLLKHGRTVTAHTYIALDPQSRRTTLDTTLAGVTLAADLPVDVDTTKPTAIDTIEWFATPLDECRTHLRLAALAAKPGLAPVADILRINPGIPFGPEWTDVRFKGGSEAGVAYVSWRFTRNDGRSYTLAGGASDPATGVNSTRAVTTIAAGLRLLDR
jgi:beta-lactamase class A